MLRHLLPLAPLTLFAACSEPPPADVGGNDPDAANVVAVDRFQDSFATLFKRSGPAFDPANVQPVVPAPNAPIDFDSLFLVPAFGPNGEEVSYYALDILGETPGDAIVVVDADGERVKDQLPILRAIPGDAGFNDFVRVTEVTVADDYVANTFASAADVDAAVDAGDATAVVTDRIENWSVVPKGSIATMKFDGKAVDDFRGWYDGAVASYLQFETNLTVTDDGKVPTSGIVVIFVDDMSPAQGFATADGRTHNALETLPGDEGYSSLWAHQRGALAGFDDVVDYGSAVDNIAGPLPVTVNCPVVAP